MNHLKLYEHYTAYWSVSDDEIIEFRKITDRIKGGLEPTKVQSGILDKIMGYENVYNTTKKWVNNKIFNSLKKLDIEDVEDRLCEFFDEIPEFDPYIMFSISYNDIGGNGSVGINDKKLNNESYLIKTTGGMLADMIFFCRISSSKKEVDDFYNSRNPCIYIELNNKPNHINHQSPYSILFLQEISDRIIKRFKYLYDVSHYYQEYEPREERRYDSNTSANSYQMLIYLN